MTEDLYHYSGLYPAYACAILGWLAWHSRTEVNHRKLYFKRPGIEFLWAIVAIAMTLAIGQLYMHGYLLPISTRGALLAESVNQLLIFSPFLVIWSLRDRQLESIWLPTKGIVRSIVIGMGLALIAISIYLLVHGRWLYFGSVVQQIYSLDHIPHLIQVFLEDLAIAFTFVRFAHWLGYKKSIWIVSLLFAAAHIPAMLISGFSPENILTLLLDGFLAVGVLYVLMKYQNFLWFWMIHFAMDMMQFVE